MTKITEQLESLTQKEIIFIHGLFKEAVDKTNSDIEHVKKVSGFLNAMKDLTEAYFADGEIAKVINQEGQDISQVNTREEAKEEIERLEANKEEYSSILNKLTALIEIVSENGSN